MACSVSGRDESSLALWLATRAGKMALSCPLGVHAVPRKKIVFFFHIIKPSLAKLVRSRWLDIGLVFFCVFMDLNSVSVHKHAQKELGQYPAILTSCLINNPYILSCIFTSILLHVFTRSLLYCSNKFRSLGWLITKEENIFVWKQLVYLITSHKEDLRNPTSFI